MSKRSSELTALHTIMCGIYVWAVNWQTCVVLESNGIFEEQYVMGMFTLIDKS